MNIGDLVVRIWCDKPLWSMIGIIVEKKFQPVPSGGAGWRYGIHWSEQAPWGGVSNNLGAWTSEEFMVLDEGR